MTRYYRKHPLSPEVLVETVIDWAALQKDIEIIEGLSSGVISYVFKGKPFWHVSATQVANANENTRRLMEEEMWSRLRKMGVLERYEIRVPIQTPITVDHGLSVEQMYDGVVRGSLWIDDYEAREV